MVESQSCFICQKHQGELSAKEDWIDDGQFLRIFHAPLLNKEKIYLGYLMIEPKRHIQGLDELNEDEAREAGAMLAVLSRALKAVCQAEHVYSFVMGHHVPHLHIHVVPRYPGTPREYWGVRVDEWPEAPRGGKEEIKEICEKIRHFLNHND
jgi:histidine triad (HIT) family protein